MNKLNFLIVDDEINILTMIDLAIKSMGYSVEVFSEPAKALERVKKVFFDIAFIDLKMPGMNGIELLEKIKNESFDTLVILMTAHGSIETAVEAIKKGAYDYLSKPFEFKEFSLLTTRIIQHYLLTKEVTILRSQIGEPWIPVPQSRNQKMNAVLNTASKAAATDFPVLIEGESGTGKEVLARFIHNSGARNNAPFIAINCAAIPESLFESELFGHVKGSYTGALNDKTGKLESANGGTVFLDEVAEIPRQMQIKLLRFLQEMEIERIGENRIRKVDIRIISATNKNIEQVLKNGEMREDLFYRISAIRISLPPLRERIEDIEFLLKEIIGKLRPGKSFRIDPKVLGFLSVYNFPGNIRELENVVKHMLTFANSELISIDSLPSWLPDLTVNENQRIQTGSLAEAEKKHIEYILGISSNMREAASLLDISETTLWRKRKEFGI